MTNKKFYIFLFICFFLSKEIFATSYCKKKTLNSVKFFKEEDFPIINLVFKKKIDIDDIYYNSYYYDENEGEDVRDFLVFYYGKPDGENFTYFCTTPDFNDVLKNNKLKGKTSKDLNQNDGVYIIDDNYIDKTEYIDKTDFAQYYINGALIEKCEYFLFKEGLKYKMYKKLILKKKEDTNENMKNVNFIIPDLNDKKKTNVKQISKIQLKPNNSLLPIECILVIEFYLKSKKETITAKIYRKKVLMSSTYYTYNCEVFYNGVSISDGFIELINDDKKEKNKFEIDNI